MKRFIIKEDVAQGILEYLASRPYVEVVGLIQALMQIEEIKKED